ncbi:HEPN domain-containing protein [Fictibacillus terranigra]|uniref:HEPN domain-containing protein n=1 Tax=Fictibacillus terranigra TaxID=3058424 RepID=A0ABT8E7H7_9BACL|nr:HEPN domain-containing protein [Fictibacillus sp. CENA-BCM004]MDN4073868.1 HEPN domain-containing protein [Fictibacillus sp. CENA-BCM004]
MTYQLESFNNFNNALVEVGLLTAFASKCQSIPEQYAALNKSALVLLTAKFEVFVEDVVEEYVEEINSMNLTTLMISEHLKIKHTVSKLQAILDKKDKKR